MTFLSLKRRSFAAGIVVVTGFLPGDESTAKEIPGNVRQLVVGRADSWKASRAQLRCYERPSERAPWRRAVFAAEIPVLLGRNGLGWGRGVLEIPNGSTAPVKLEGDGRAPAGCFRIGRVFGYPVKSPNLRGYPYRMVTEWDAWVDDVNHPYYNRHVVVDPAAKPAWFESQRMRLGDHAYTYLIEIRHNADPIEPGMGSAIFFHIRRGPDKPTSGCTTMERRHLESIIRWLEEAKRPHYVLLPQADYTALQQRWKLPEW